MAAWANVYCTSLPALECVCTGSPLWAKYCIQRWLLKYTLRPVLSFYQPHVSSPPLVTSCGMPVPPVNGSIGGQDFSLGARATYQCNPGFRLTGPITTSVTCQESGRWSPIEAPPRCVREYLSQRLVYFWQWFQLNKMFILAIFKVFPTFPDNCYQLTVWFNKVCLSSNLPAVTCPDIGHSAVEHGRWRLIYGTQNQYDTLMMLICDPGYYYRGQRVIRCQANSTWNYPDPRPVCESKLILCMVQFSLFLDWIPSVWSAKHE